VDGHLEPGAAAASAPATGSDAAVLDTVRLPRLDLEDLRLEDPGGPVRVIRALPHQILTGALELRPSVENGAVVADPSRDLLKLACVERHGRHGAVAVGLVTGFGLQRGALASTVGHDHHNLLVVGAEDEAMLMAADRLQALGGGFVAVQGGRVLAELPLEIAGLVTDAPLADVRRSMRALDDAAVNLGATLPAPFMALSFLGLPVIPELRLTDRGLVDVLAGRIVPFAAEG